MHSKHTVLHHQLPAYCFKICSAHMHFSCNLAPLCMGEDVAALL